MHPLLLPLEADCPKQLQFPFSTFLKLLQTECRPLPYLTSQAKRLIMLLFLMSLLYGACGTVRGSISQTSTSIPQKQWAQNIDSTVASWFHRGVLLDRP